jgi:hypothetical protein
LLFAGSLLAASVLSVAQTAPSTPPPPTWDVFGGGTFQRAVGNDSLPHYNFYGWDTSVSERPYRSHPWIGATVEASGAYRNVATSASGFSIREDSGAYTIMGGPSAVLKLQRIQPFARALLGVALERDAVSVGGQNSSSAWSHFFGTAFGGGVDVPVNGKFAIRGQADWLRVWAANLQGGNSIRASAGGVFRF